MCRNIKTLFNFEPPATEDEIHASAVQFVRKLSGFNTPSKSNVEAFDRAVAEVSAAARKLLADGRAVGRRLDFLAQEFGRETNTLCAKSNDASLTSLGLELKVEVEQLREQAQNIE